MRSLLLFFATISLSMLFGVAVHEARSAAGHCTAHDRIQLGQAGYPKADRDDLCGLNSGDIPLSSPWGILAGEGQPRWIQWCVTSQGRCSLNPATSGYYPIGAPCNCSMPWGSYGGVAQ